MATGLIAKFPESFCQRPHPAGQVMNTVGWQWQLLDAQGDCMVSVVGGEPAIVGGHKLPVWYGDGINTFEMWDMVNEPEPHAWLTKDEINAHLSEKGIVDPMFEDLNIKIIEPKEES
jgi:hypothetical protein